DVLQAINDVGDVLSHTLSLYKLALTVGCNSASCERSFSAMKIVKSYLRSAMCQDRLLGLSLLYCEKSLEINTE
ncbi:hypothetical protein CAPTEDRAFT_59353, partial [Capitella teleta]